VNNVGSKTLFNPVFINSATTWSFLAVHLFLQQLWYYFPNCVYPCQFPCGRKPECPEKTHNFWQSIDRLYSHESIAKIEPTISALGERHLLRRLHHRSPIYLKIFKNYTAMPGIVPGIQTCFVIVDHSVCFYYHHNILTGSLTRKAIFSRALIELL
jgi:hypothetical protein